MNGRLLLIEARRSVGLLALLAVPVWFWLNRNLSQAAPFWFETSLIVRNATGAIGPILGGAAAWMAGRESRRGLQDLLATTPQSQITRRLTTLLGATVWGLLGYLLVGAVVLAFGWSRATWGGPFFGPILVGLVALPVYAALGFAIGRRFPGRFAAPLVAVALLVVPFIVGQSRDSRAFLSPLVSLGGSVRYGIQPDLTGLQLAFLLCLGGVALATLALPARKPWQTALSCVMLTALLATPVAVIWAVAPSHGGQGLSNDPRYRTLELIPYTPICMEAPMPVCVHPAYRGWLAETTASLNHLIAPLLGLPGAPTRAEQGYAAVQGKGDTTGTTLWFTFDAQPNGLAISSLVVFGLVNAPYVRPEAVSTCPATATSCRFAQRAIGAWLLRRVGIDDTSLLHDTGQATSAVDRFAALDPATQRAWLEAHFADLRAGRVTLEEMP